jgi:hypothetical protein
VSKLKEYVKSGLNKNIEEIAGLSGWSDFSKDGLVKFESDIMKNFDIEISDI